MADPYIAAPDGQHGRCEGGQGDDTLLLVADGGPYLDHIHVVVGTVVEIDRDGVDGVFQTDGRHGRMAFVLGGQTRGHQCRREVAVGMTHGKGGFGGRVEAIGGIGIHPAIAWILQTLCIAGAQPLSEVDILRCVSFVGLDDEAHVFGLNGHCLCLGEDETGQQSDEDKGFLHSALLLDD